MDIKAALGNLKIDLKTIKDENLRGCIILLFNAVEQLSSENTELRKENQKFRDEINRLKGEQGKPDIRPQKKNSTDISSESERKNNDSDDNDTGNPKRTQPKKDSLMTITETAKKLLVNTYKYFYDRLSGKREMPSLADLIRQRSSPILDLS